MYLDWDVQLDGLAAHAGLRVGHAVVAHGDRSPRDAHGGAAGALRHELEAHAEVVGGAQSASLLKTQEQASEQACEQAREMVTPVVPRVLARLAIGREQVDKRSGLRVPEFAFGSGAHRLQPLFQCRDRCWISNDAKLVVRRHAQQRLRFAHKQRREAHVS